MRQRSWRTYGIGVGGGLLLVMAILLASGWGSAVAAQITSVFVNNDAAHPVPVQEQRADANGNVKVHEQGTANVNVTNDSVPVKPGLPAPVDATAGFGAGSAGGQSETFNFGKTIDISYLNLTIGTRGAGLVTISFMNGSDLSLELPGPGDGADQSDYRLPLTQPVRADRARWFCGSPCSFFVNVAGTQVSP